ncbi:hypothetical protein GCM10023091_07830 [Ravibacter arvi]|uniref:DUF4402 domain-containing protein n=1 Tax=Ravibacter arvi TaxID=2051041 RepID=A0ABP8LSY8_9BACT
MRRGVLLLCLLLPVTVIYAQKITVTGNWSVPNFNSQKPVEAGSDYVSSFVESASNQTLLNVNGTGGVLGLLLTGFNIQVRQTVTGPALPPGLILRARRTGEGLGYLIGLVPLPNILGYYTNYGVPKNEYLTLTSANQNFFGFFATASLSLGSVNDIPIQYRLEGLSVLLPVNTYSITVTYTVSP